MAGVEATRSPAENASVLATAPSFHAGGVADLAPDELPAVLWPSDAVLTPGEKRRSPSTSLTPGTTVRQ